MDEPKSMEDSLECASKKHKLINWTKDSKQDFCDKEKKTFINSKHCSQEKMAILILPLLYPSKQPIGKTVMWVVNCFEMKGSLFDINPFVTKQRKEEEKRCRRRKNYNKSKIFTL